MIAFDFDGVTYNIIILSHTPHGWDGCRCSYYVISLPATRLTEKNHVTLLISYSIILLRRYIE